jgi:hypothetical protein
MDQEQVQVVTLEVLQVLLHSERDVLGRMVRLPELGHDEELLALDDSLIESLADAVAALELVAVVGSAVDVANTALDGLVDLRLSIGVGDLPGAVGRKLKTNREGESMNLKDSC